MQFFRRQTRPKKYSIPAQYGGDNPDSGGTNRFLGDDHEDNAIIALALTLEHFLQNYTTDINGQPALFVPANSTLFDSNGNVIARTGNNPQRFTGPDSTTTGIQGIPDQFEGGHMVTPGPGGLGWLYISIPSNPLI